MFLVERVRRGPDGRIMEVEGFAQTVGHRTEMMRMSVAELMSRLRHGEDVNTFARGRVGCAVKVARGADGLECIADAPSADDGPRLANLPEL
jgi:hypothetical protein